MRRTRQGWPVRRLFGVPLDALAMTDVLKLVDDAIEGGDHLLIGVVNAAKLVNMRSDLRLRDAVLSADLILADGMAVVWASRLLRRRLPQRLAGIDLMHAMLRRSIERDYRIYLLGARDEVLQMAISRMRDLYPGVAIVGHRNGYFPPAREPDIVAAIRDAKPDILFVAMSPPRKEVFLARWFRELNVPICHGVGGAFDVLAGKTLRAPERWQRLGLEWLYRLKQEPRRLIGRYLVTNTFFCTMVLAELLGLSPSEG